jgi:putative membrane protein
MMDGYDLGGGGWIMMIIAWAAVLAVIVWALVTVGPGRGFTRSAPTERPLDILDRRLARGEIDADAYDHLRTKLTGSERETAKAGSRDG